MPFFDFTQPASFNATKFPVDNIRVRGDKRKFIHVYPHMAGGNLEKLGRNLYKITVHIPADENIKAYPGIYPGGVEALRSFYEQDLTATLTLPNLGSIQATIDEWDQEANFRKSRSGEDVTLVFLEDMPAVGLDVFTSQVQNLTNLSNKLQNVTAIANQAQDVDPSLWTSLNNAMGKLLALEGTAEMTLDVLEARIASVTNWINAIDASIQNPLGYNVLSALLDLSDAVQNFAANGLLPAGAASSLVSPFGVWTVPMLMTMPDISTAIFGDSTHTMELLQMNNVDDYSQVPKGFPVNYIKPVAAAA